MKIIYGLTFDLCRQQYILAVDGEERLTSYHLNEALAFIATDLRTQVGSANHIIRRETDEVLHAFQLHEQAHAEPYLGEVEEPPFTETHSSGDIPPEQEPVEGEVICTCELVGEEEEDQVLTEAEQAEFVERRLSALGITL